MICVTRVKVHPDRIYIKTGQAYTDATAQVSPPEATNPSVKWSSSNPNIVNVHPYNRTMLGVSEGTATVYATAQDGSGKKDCCTVVVSKRILVRGITLSFTNIDLGTDVDYSLPVAKVSPDSADNRTVRWCSDNPDVATIKNGRIYTHLEGKATLTAVATDGSGVSASCKVNVYKTIYVSSVTLSASNKVMRVGESVTLSAEVCPDNATNRGYMWLSSDESIATVNPASGLVIAQKPGTTTICAESVDGSGKKGVCTVTVKESIPVDSITFDRTDVFLRPGDRYEIFKVICPSNATNKSLLWTSTNPDVASINNGVIRAKSNGVTTIIAVPADGGGKPVEASCSVWVSDYTPVSSVTVSPSSKTMTVGDSFTPHATVCPDNATNKKLQWKSSDEKVVTVRGDSGLVFAQGPGTTTIWAMTVEGMGVFDSCQITVKNAVPVRSVMVCPAETSISVGKSASLTATVYPRGASNKSVRWSSDRPDVATVSKTGTATATVTGRSVGTATITAMTADGGFVSSCRVTVGYCGGANYRDVTQHTMCLQTDGYYVCSKCGYRIKSPVLQDKEILNPEDYYKVLSCYLTIPYYAALEESEQVMYIPVEMLLGQIDAIRSQSQYAKRYDYVDHNGVYKCEHTLEVPEDSHWPQYSRLDIKYDEITHGNKFLYNGVAEALIGFIAGLFVPTPEIQAILFSVTDKSNVIDNLAFLFTQWADLAGVKEIGKLVELIGLGASGNESIEVTDKIVNIQFANTLATIESTVVFTKDGTYKAQYNSYAL